MLFLNREEGQGLVEYALVLVLVAVVVIAILTLLGPQIGNVFSRIVDWSWTPPKVLFVYKPIGLYIKKRVLSNR